MWLRRKRNERRTERTFSLFPWYFYKGGHENISNPSCSWNSFGTSQGVAGGEQMTSPVRDRVIASIENTIQKVKLLTDDMPEDEVLFLVFWKLKEAAMWAKEIEIEE